MFDKQEYIEVFSKVTASGTLKQEVLNMAKTKDRKLRLSGRRAAVLAAAVILLMGLTVTAFAAEDIALWFRSYFSRNGEKELTQQQIAFISENEQFIGNSQTVDGWTITLQSVIHDDTAGYLIFTVTAPEDTALARDSLERYIFGNFTQRDDSMNAVNLLTASREVSFGSWGFQWQDDGDGNANTRRFVIHLSPSAVLSAVEPFGSKAEYYVHIENIVMETEDEAYRRQLMVEKYKGVKHPQFTQEEKERLYSQEVLAEGIWEFTVSFADPGNSRTESVELLTEPVAVNSITTYFRDGEMMETERKLTLHSVTMRHLTVSFHYGECEGDPDLSTYVSLSKSDGSGFEPVKEERQLPCVVLKDGTEIDLLYNGFHCSECVTLEAEMPIVFEEVSHIRMADGTIIPMPESE